MRSPLLNPIKFYKVSNLPDYLTTFPNPDNTPFGTSWSFGVNASPYFIRYHVGIMYLQMEVETADVKDLTVYKLTNGVFGSSSTISGVDISPVGWTGKKIYLYTVNLTEGIYYLTTTTGLQSDYFRIYDSAEDTEDLVKIEYTNSENDFGCILGVRVFYAYFVGSLTPDAPKNEYSNYTDDRGESVKLRSTPQRTAILSLKGIHSGYIDLLNMIFSLDDIEVNGIGYENEEAPTWEGAEGCDTGNITVKLLQKTNDYYYGIG